MTMGTRIVVMKDGVVQQIDTPTNLFDYPENTFVAGFIGTPQMNLFPVSLTAAAGQCTVVFRDGAKMTFEEKNMRRYSPDTGMGKRMSASSASAGRTFLSAIWALPPLWNFRRFSTTKRTCT